MRDVIDTPCIGVCSTVYGDDICRGCKRRSTEVIAWNTYSNAEKQSILHRLNHLVSELTSQYFTITNSELFNEAISKYQIRVLPGYQRYCLAYYLIRAVIDRVDDLSPLALKINPVYKHLSAHEAFKSLDDKLLSTAHSQLAETENEST